MSADACLAEEPKCQTPPTEQPPASLPTPVDPDLHLEVHYGQAVFPGSNGAVGSLNERFFAARFQCQEKILFEPEERRFYQYIPDTGLWDAQSDDRVREALSAHVLEYGRDADIALEAKVTAAKMGAVMQVLRGVGEQREAFIRKGDFVHVANGVIRFSEGGRVQLTGFSPEDFSRNRCPIRFDPDGECPTFLNDLLRSALPDADINLLQCWAGLAIAGINPAQRMLILDGGAGTGKSTFAKLVQKIVGADNCAQLRTALLLERFEIFRFVGRTLLLAPDVPGDFLNSRAASVLKSLVGGDPLTAEAKGSNEVFTLEGNFNALVTSNSRLRVRLDGDSGAWRRRLVIIRFDRPPPAKRTPNLAEKLVAEEGSGILKWCLAGLLRARSQLADTGDLALNPEQQLRVDALLAESDSIRRFVKECTERGSGDVTGSEMVEAYYRFCAEREWTPQTAKTVERVLKETVLEHRSVSQSNSVKRCGKAQRGWRGLQFVGSSEINVTDDELVPAHENH